MVFLFFDGRDSELHDSESGEEKVMGFGEKARIRIEHWLKHNESHLNDYREFADQLEEAGMHICAAHIRNMAELNEKSNQCLIQALSALD